MSSIQPSSFTEKKTVFKNIGSNSLVYTGKTNPMLSHCSQIKDFMLNIFSMFRSKRVCESKFFLINQVKSKYKYRMADEVSQVIPSLMSRRGI